MELSQFFSILKELVLKFMKVFTQQLPEFHSLLSQILCNSPKDTELDTLPLIPLRDGCWVRQVDGQCHFGTDNARLLQKLSEGVDDLRIVDATASRDPIRRTIFTRLGVKDLNKAEACRLITVRLCPFSAEQQRLTSFSVFEVWVDAIIRQQQLHCRMSILCSPWQWRPTVSVFRILAIRSQKCQIYHTTTVKPYARLWIAMCAGLWPRACLAPVYPSRIRVPTDNRICPEES